MTTRITAERDHLRNAAKSALQRIDAGQGNSAAIESMLRQNATLTQVLTEIIALCL